MLYSLTNSLKSGANSSFTVSPFSFFPVTVKFVIPITASFAISSVVLFSSSVGSSVTGSSCCGVSVSVAVGCSSAFSLVIYIVYVLVVPFSAVHTTFTVLLPSFSFTVPVPDIFCELSCFSA